MRRYSEFAKTALTPDGTLYRTGLSFVDLLYAGGIVYHTVLYEEQGRPDLIAYKYLGDAYLWEFLCWFNNISDPLTGFYVNRDIAIPIDVKSSSFGQIVKASTY